MKALKINSIERKAKLWDEHCDLTQNGITVEITYKENDIILRSKKVFPDCNNRRGLCSIMLDIRNMFIELAIRRNEST